MSLDNPFEYDVTPDPWQTGSTVTTLNAAALTTLLQQFDRLDRGPLPHLDRHPSRVCLLASTESGNGNTHLLGRLFRALDRRATIIHLRDCGPGATSVWRSLLRQTLTQMAQPDSPTTGTPSQLTTFIHGVMAQVWADFLQTRRARVTETIRKLRADPVQAYALAQDDKPGGWPDRLVRIFENPRKFVSLIEHLGQRCPGLHASPGSWLRIFRTMVFHSDDTLCAEACMNWLLCEPITPEEATLLGLLSDRHIPPDAQCGTEELAKERLLDLCQLSGFVRPFVLVFDPTEHHIQSEASARLFGQVVHQLADAAVNQLTIVSVHQPIWERHLRPFWTPAARDRVEDAPPTAILTGVQRRDAMLLIKQRLEKAIAHPDQARRFLDGAWIDTLFSERDSILGLRTFLKACRERWRDVVDPDPPDLARVPTEDETAQSVLETAWRDRLADVAQRPEPPTYNVDLLTWLVRDVALGLPPLIHIRSLPSGAVRWLTDQQTTIHIGFEAGHLEARWLDLAQWAAGVADRLSGFKALYFRTPDLSPIPDATWEQVDTMWEAMTHHLDILTLDERQCVTLQTAWELSQDPALEKAALVPFVRQQLAFLWERILTTLQPDVDTAEEIDDEDPENDAEQMVDRVAEETDASDDDTEPLALIEDFLPEAEQDDVEDDEDETDDTDTARIEDFLPAAEQDDTDDASDDVVAIEDETDDADVLDRMENLIPDMEDALDPHSEEAEVVEVDVMTEEDSATSARLEDYIVSTDADTGGEEEWERANWEEGADDSDEWTEEPAYVRTDGPGKDSFMGGGADTWSSTQDMEETDDQDMEIISDVGPRDGPGMHMFKPGNRQNRALHVEPGDSVTYADNRNGDRITIAVGSPTASRGMVFLNAMVGDEVLMDEGQPTQRKVHIVALKKN